MADDRRAAALAARSKIVDRLTVLEERLRSPESEAAGELADVDQHPADAATETYDREAWIQRIETLREELRALDDAIENPHDVPVPRGRRLDEDPDDVLTPLDRPEQDPVDLGTIPMGHEETIDEDLQDLDAPGAIYHEGAGEPAVGEPDDVDLDVERRYRPRT